MKRSTGFTLIELMVTIAVIVVLLALGVPKMQQYATSNRTVAQLNRISGDLALARSEAIKRGSSATVCASDDSTTSTPSCSGTNAWEDGWIAFADLNNDGAFNGTDVLISVAEALPGGLTMRTADFDDAAVVRFRANGAVADTDGDGDSDGTFTVCDSDGTLKKARALNVSNLGRTSVATDTDGDDIVNDVTTANVGCP
jgi:type IV fimbrial biogenesis protein FimT